MRKSDRSVFINCPFDAEYKPCLEALIFTIATCGYQVRCALEDDDGANIRFTKLVKLIRASRRSVHDLTRVQLGPTGDPRFNMPFELGLTMGARHFGDKEQKKKTALVMVTRRFALPPALSDMAGADQQPHNDNPREVIKIVGRYLDRTPDGQEVPGTQWIWNSFQVFKNETLPLMAGAARKTPAEVDPLDDFRAYNRFVVDHCSEVAMRTPISATLDVAEDADTDSATGRSSARGRGKS